MFYCYSWLATLINSSNFDHRGKYRVSYSHLKNSAQQCCQWQDFGCKYPPQRTAAIIYASDFLAKYTTMFNFLLFQPNIILHYTIILVIHLNFTISPYNLNSVHKEENVIKRTTVHQVEWEKKANSCNSWRYVY